MKASEAIEAIQHLIYRYGERELMIDVTSPNGEMRFEVPPQSIQAIDACIVIDVVEPSRCDQI
jgi:hypothetical protein